MDSLPFEIVYIVCSYLSDLDIMSYFTCSTMFRSMLLDYPDLHAYYKITIDDCISPRNMYVSYSNMNQDHVVDHINSIQYPLHIKYEINPYETVGYDCLSLINKRHFLELINIRDSEYAYASGTKRVCDLFLNIFKNKPCKDDLLQKIMERCDAIILIGLSKDNSEYIMNNNMSNISYVSRHYMEAMFNRINKTAVFYWDKITTSGNNFKGTKYISTITNFVDSYKNIPNVSYIVNIRNRHIVTMMANMKNIYDTIIKIHIHEIPPCDKIIDFRVLPNLRILKISHSVCITITIGTNLHKLISRSTNVKVVAYSNTIKTIRACSGYDIIWNSVDFTKLQFTYSPNIYSIIYEKGIININIRHASKDILEFIEQHIHTKERFYEVSFNDIRQQDLLEFIDYIYIHHNILCYPVITDMIWDIYKKIELSSCD